MKQKDTDNPTLNPEKPLLTRFLHELNVSRRQLSLYPPDHPQVMTSSDRILEILTDLFHANQIITLGIAPDALYFEQLWLDTEESTHREFANFFSKLGIASISFRQGLSGAELIRFNLLFTASQRKKKSFEDFERLFEQNQIEHIAVIAIDYDAFQVNQDSAREDPETGELWEKFLHGLHSGLLDFGTLDSRLSLGVIADIFNQKLTGNKNEREQSSRSVNLFIENSIFMDSAPQATSENSKKLAMLLEELSPDAQREFISNTFRALEKHQDKAPGLLRKIPPHLLQNTIVGKDHQSLNLSSRLYGLINNLAASQDQPAQRQIKTATAPLSQPVVRARLAVLFSEEQQEHYLPDSYQTALHDILGDNVVGAISETEKEKLKSQIEIQAAETNCAAIIFELLQDQQKNSEYEQSLEQNLLDLSRFFLDIGDFITLRKIFSHWSYYLSNYHSDASILGEKVLSNHTQPTFMAEVLDGVDLWGEEKHQEIADYIITVGEPYCESVIRRLGLAQEWLEQQFWMEILEKIGHDAQQIIIASLDDERWALVRNLLIVLGKNIGPYNLKAIHKQLGHPHPKVRLEAVRNLLSCNPATANRQLLKELNDPDPEAQLAAVQVADLSRDPKVLAILHKQLGSTVDNNVELELKIEIVRTLTRIGNQESLPVLRRVLQKQGLLVSRRIKQLQKEILYNLTTFPGTSTDKLLQELADEKYKQEAKQVIQQRRTWLRRKQ